MVEVDSGGDEFAALSAEELAAAHAQARGSLQAAFEAAVAVGAHDPDLPELDWTESEDATKRNAALSLNAAMARSVAVQAAVVKRHEDDLEQQALQLRRDWNATHDYAGTGDAAAPGTEYITRAVFTYTPPADGPSPLRPAGSDTCVFCGSPDTIWQHDLNSSLTRWRDEYGYGMAWSDSLALCDDCETLWAQSEYWQLLQRQLTSDEEGPENTVEGRLLSIAAFCRADRGPRRQS